MIRIRTLTELAAYIEPVAGVFDDLDSRFSSGLTTLEKAAKLVEYFRRDSYYFGHMGADDTLLFFALIVPINETEVNWHLLYSHSAYKHKTKTHIRDIKSILEKDGFSTIYSITQRITPSYKRFMKSLGGHPCEIKYKMETK